MVYEIPNDDGGQDEALSRISSAVLKDLGWANVGTGRVAATSGLVTAPAGANRAASVSAGLYYIDHSVYSLSESASVALSANSSGYDRIDILEIDSNGSVSVIEGTPGNASAAAVEPERSVSADGLRPTKCKLAAILVKNGDTTIPSSQILQRTFEVVPHYVIHRVHGYPAPYFGVDGDFAINEWTREIFHKESGAWSSLGWHIGGQAFTVNNNWTNDSTSPIPAGCSPTAKLLRRVW